MIFLGKPQLRTRAWPSILALFGCGLFAVFVPTLCAQDTIPFSTDFEQGLRAGDGWVRNGPVFQNQPIHSEDAFTENDELSLRHQGQWWVNSAIPGDTPLACPPPPSEEYTGQMNSSLFLIRGGSLSFLVGGGSGFETRVELLISNGGLLEGELEQRVYHASGRNSEAMREVSWNLETYKGEQAFIRILDESQNNHISVDYFRFSMPPFDCPGGVCPALCSGVICSDPDPDCPGADCTDPDPDCFGPDCTDPDPDCPGADCTDPDPDCPGPDCTDPDPDCLGPDCTVPDPDCLGPDCTNTDPDCPGSDCRNSKTACTYKKCDCNELVGLERIFQWIYCNWPWVFFVLITTIIVYLMWGILDSWPAWTKRRQREKISYKSQPGKGKASMAPGSRLKPEFELRYRIVESVGFNCSKHPDDLVLKERREP